MQDIIQLLPDALANQIAAGEVVQRPASVVKELLENSIDAHAAKIKLIIKEAGKTLVQVIDDGVGMTETDARMCLERHATSKIKTSNDLFAIRTMGFRGEAMASIAAVAQVEVKTKKAENDLGTLIQVEASEIVKQVPIATEKGTSIAVKNLFYNVPARRNFLKSTSVEMRHIIDEFNRITLANPSVHFSLYQNDKQIMDMPVGNLGQRIVHLFGKNYQTQMASCREETGHIGVSGYIGRPESAKKTRGEQFFFVNNRFIKNNYLNHAVNNAFEGLLQPGSYPFYVLFIEIDPKHIDINVHPTKTEIKFDDERTVYGVVRAAVRQALGTHNITPSLDFDHDVNFNKPSPIQIRVERSSTEEREYSQFKSSPLQQSNRENWDLMYQGLERSSLNFDRQSSEDDGATITFESAANKLSDETNINSMPEMAEKSPIFQLHNKYLVSQVKSGIIIVDQKAAHERILYEQNLEYIENHSGSSQQSLFPQSLELNLSDYTLVMEMKEEIEALGFQFEEFGNNCIVINGVPADIASGNEKALFEGLVEQYKQNQSELSISKRENLARALAKRSSVKEGKRLEVEEINMMFDKLFACTSPNFAPDGRATFKVLGMDRIDNIFN